MQGQMHPMLAYGAMQGYAPAPPYPQGGYEIGYGNAHPQAHVPCEAGAQVGYYNINGYYDIGAAAPMLHPAGAYGGFAPLAQGAFNATPTGISPSQPSTTMQRPLMIGGAKLTDKAPTTDRVLWLGFKSSSTIAASANSAVSSSPQDTFAPRKVVIPGSVAPNFEIVDLKIGAISQLSSSDPIPAEAFIPNASLTDVHFDTAQISQQVTFSVNNISNAAATFRGAMNGFVVRM